MSKRLLILLTAACLLSGMAGCMKDVSTGQQDAPLPIRFNAPAVGAATKTDAGYPNHEMPVTYNTAEHFSVYAMDATTDFSHIDFSVSANNRYYMANEDCAYVSDYNAWVPVSPFYWLPAFVGSYYMNFQAYSPTVAQEDCTIGHSWTNGFTFTGFTPRTPGEQYDLLYSELHTDKQRPNYSGSPYDETTGDAGSYKGIDLCFNHALTSIHFKIRAAVPSDAIQQIYLQKITVRNAWNKGSFDQHLDDTDPAGWSIDGDATETSYVVYQNTGAATDGPHLVESATPENDFFSIPNALMIIPQALNHDGGTPGDTSDDVHIAIEVTYARVIAASGKVVVSTETADLVTGNNNGYYQGHAGTDPDAPIDSWRMGFRYTYKLTLNLFKVFVDPTVSAWNDFNPEQNLEL